MPDCGGRGIEEPWSERADQPDFMKTIIEMGEINEVISPILYVVPLQLLAYHVALIKGTDVDQPRNLAKSVTVE